MIYAIIDNEMVSNIIEWDGEDSVFDGFTLVPVPDGIAAGPGWSYKNGSFERVFFEVDGEIERI